MDALARTIQVRKRGSMKIVIDIPENIYECVKKRIISDEIFDELVDAFRNGTPLPKGHGRLIDADKCIKQAWNDFYNHEDEWEKKDKDYLPFGRFYDQNGFECCLKTIGESPTVIEREDGE